MRAADFISHLRLELEYLMNLEYMVASISLTIYKSILDLISLSDRKKREKIQLQQFVIRGTHL